MHNNGCRILNTNFGSSKLATLPPVIVKHKLFTYMHACRNAPTRERKCCHASPMTTDEILPNTFTNSFVAYPIRV